MDTSIHPMPALGAPSPGDRPATEIQALPWKQALLLAAAAVAAFHLDRPGILPERTLFPAVFLARRRSRLFQLTPCLAGGAPGHLRSRTGADAGGGGRFVAAQ